MFDLDEQCWMAVPEKLSCSFKNRRLVTLDINLDETDIADVFIV